MKTPKSLQNIGNRAIKCIWHCFSCEMDYLSTRLRSFNRLKARERFRRLVLRSTLLTLCYWPIYIREREGEEEVGSDDPTYIAMAHLKVELWLVRWYQNKHGGHNESNKAFENKCYLLYEINIFWINNSQVRKVIHGWLSAWPAGSHRLVSWFLGSAKGSPGNQETRRQDQLVPQTINHGFP